MGAAPQALRACAGVSSGRFRRYPLHTPIAISVVVRHIIYGDEMVFANVRADRID
jgi:hypothetical protein